MDTNAHITRLPASHRYHRRRQEEPVLAHHALDSSNTLLHLVTHLLVAGVSVP
jgi:hypothetical protein